tara:strand:+ start:29689 stop:30003 length:315 start_codon:yes stop_codon:yes gene_type:complete
MSDCVTWAEADTIWNQTEETWSEICLAVKIIEGGGGFNDRLRKLRREPRKQQKKFIKLLCKIKGEEYNETKYFVPNVSVKASDFKIVEKELLKPELQIFINKNK